MLWMRALIKNKIFMYKKDGRIQILMFLAAPQNYSSFTLYFKDHFWFLYIPKGNNVGGLVGVSG